jgi:NifU-like protein involved in Fe-S cluster formation
MGDDIREQYLRELGYTEKAIAYILTEPNVGELDNPSIVARHQGHCGDIMILHLAIDAAAGRITDARYRITGCAGLQASANAVTTLVRGMALDDAAGLDTNHIVAHLGGSFPDFKMDCVELARDTLHKAVAAYRDQSS